MSISRRAAIAACALAIGPQAVWAQETPSPSGQGDVEERLRRIEERLKKAEAPDALRVSWKEGLRIESPDKAFQVQIGGRIQNDWAWISGDDDVEALPGVDLDSGTRFRRARLHVAGHLHERVEFKAEYDFAGGGRPSFTDVYMGLTKIPVVGGIRAGHFKEPFSLEELTSSRFLTFLERSLPNAFAPARNTGVMIHNNALDERVTWAAGVFRDSDDFGDRTGEGEANVTARVTGLPWHEDEGERLVHLGAAYSRRSPNEDTVRFRQAPESSIAPRLVDTGNIDSDRVDLAGAEAALVLGPSSFQGEYVHAAVDSTLASDPSFSGWYAFASWFLTGERRAYKTSSGTFDRVKPKRNFLDGEGGLGAFEVAARWSSLDLDDGSISGRELRDATLALNWHPNPNTRVMLNYVRADLDDVGDADIFQIRFQVDF